MWIESSDHINLKKALQYNGNYKHRVQGAKVEEKEKIECVINEKSLKSLNFQGFHRARDWNRTSTPVKAADFESAASTNSATRAGSFKGCNVTTFCSIVNTEFLNKFSNYLQQFFLGRRREQIMLKKALRILIMQSSRFHDI